MKISAYLSLLLAIISPSLFAAEKAAESNQQQLLTSCQALTIQSAQTNPSACIYYIQGFLAGMDVTGAVNVTSPDEAKDYWTSVVERAHRTRNPAQPPRLNRLCLPIDEPLTQVLNILSKPLSSPARTTGILKEKIFQTLNEEYSCG